MNLSKVFQEYLTSPNLSNRNPQFFRLQPHLFLTQRLNPMRSIRKQYIKDLYNHFNYYPTWLPGVPLQLGDIGILHKNEFTRVSSLENEGIQFEIREDLTKMDLNFDSEGSVTITAKLAGTANIEGSVLAEAEAGISIDFQKQHATLLKLKGTVSPQISDTIVLGNEIVHRYKNGSWKKEWVVITSIVEADSSTILVSNARNAKLELKASAETKKLDIANASADL